MTFEEQRYTNVSFNADGNMLLCWNESSVGIVAIPQACMPDGAFDADGCDSHACLFSLLAAEYLSEHSSSSGAGSGSGSVGSPFGRVGLAGHLSGKAGVVQAAFHSLSPT